MEEMFQAFIIWLVKFLAIYAVVFVIVRHGIRRYLWPHKKDETNSSEVAHPPGSRDDFPSLPPP